MNGAEALMQTLVDSGIEVCFANPGTSEMHFVAAMDTQPDLRGVLCLFEGVVSGAADGYNRMAAKPAATLLHLGPGLGNALANLHNARKAHSSIVNVVGDHATYHKPLNPPLESDIDSVAGTVSGWVHRSPDSGSVGTDAAAAITAARSVPGQIATLILPADSSWSDGAQASVAEPVAGPEAVSSQQISMIAGLLSGQQRVCLLLGGNSLSVAGQLAADAIARATGAALFIENWPARMVRGGGLPYLARLAYFGEAAAEQLAGTDHLVLIGADSPVTFFAYPDKPGDLVPPGASLHALADQRHDGTAALLALAAELGIAVPEDPAPGYQRQPSIVAEDRIDHAGLAAAITAAIPEGAIVVDEAISSGFLLPEPTSKAPRHDLLTLTGGAIGQGMPTAVGAAVACPDRPVLNLQADGSAMYTVQSLWTQARESLDVTTIILDNRRYAILQLELDRFGADTKPDGTAESMLDLSTPDLDFVALAAGMGVPATRATTAAELVAQIQQALAEPGPHVVVATMAG